MNRIVEDNFRLLVVDDNRAIHEDFQKVLGPKAGASEQILATEAALFGDEPAGISSPRNSFQLDSAFQGQDALELVRQARSQGRSYAMAFMDVRMPPGWDGIETTAKIWEIDPDLQIVICTAYSDYSWDEMLGKLGQSDRMVILKKPFDNIEVLQLAGSLTKKWQFLQEAKSKMADLEKMVAARTEQVVREQQKFMAIFENSPVGILQSTPDGRFLSANPALAAILGYASPQELMEQVTNIAEQLYAEQLRRTEFQRRLEEETIVRDFETEMTCKDGSRKWTSLTACKVVAADGSSIYQGFVTDINAQKNARHEHDLMEAQLRQAQKLESVGQLAAGIAHEINTPIQYIGDNIRSVEDAFRDLSRFVVAQNKFMAAFQSNAVTPEVLAATEAASSQVDLDYLNVEVPKAIQQSLDGVKHVSTIVCAMKEFSHPGQAEMLATDLNHAIQTTLTVAHSEWKYVADVVTDFAPDLPPVLCLPGEFNQVILNLVVNAAHAIADVVKPETGAKGIIKITTRLENDWVEIRLRTRVAAYPKRFIIGSLNHSSPRSKLARARDKAWRLLARPLSKSTADSSPLNPPPAKAPPSLSGCHSPLHRQRRLRITDETILI